MENIAENISCQPQPKRTIKIKGSSNLQEILPLLDGYELFVEPLSKRKSFNDFLTEGGIGYNSYREGSFASKLFWFKTLEAPLSRGDIPEYKKPFQYGSKYMTLTNVGYPLHRMIEKAGYDFFPAKPGPVDEMIIAIRPAEPVSTFFLPLSLNDIKPYKPAKNVLYVNQLAARYFGLEKEGIITCMTRNLKGEGELVQGLWDSRFIEESILDDLPQGRAMVKIHSVPSQVKNIYKNFELSGGEVFLLLYTFLGVLLVLTVAKEKVDWLKSQIAELPLSYWLSGS